jgi:hypothetical protein
MEELQECHQLLLKQQEDFKNKTKQKTNLMNKYFRFVFSRIWIIQLSKLHIDMFFKVIK